MSPRTHRHGAELGAARILVDPPGFFCEPRADGSLALPPHREARRGEADRVHALLRARVDPAQHPCVAARSAWNTGSYRFGLYAPLATPAATAGLAADLERFALGVGEEDGEAAADASDFATFVAVFDGPADPGPSAGDPRGAEERFERRLWAQLQALHEADGRGWDPDVSADPGDAAFSFSFAGRSFYLIGMHPHASRPARRLARPAVAFNLHAQFERLRGRGAYRKMRDLIRDRDRQQTGSVNPMLADFGDRSEAAQYSGRAVGADWACPFHAKSA